MAPRVGGLTEAEAELVADQWRGLVSGLRAIPGISWVNRPEANAVAESKIVQMAAASSLGIRVPATLVTNSRSAALRFLDQHGEIVAKALLAPLIEDVTNPRFVFTTRVGAELIGSMESNEASPLILQRLIAPKRDVRVTVVGGRVFAAAVSDADEEQIDWRARHPRPAFEVAAIPDSVIHHATALTRQLDLRFAAIDFVVDQRGRYYFLEVNPNGEWGWLQHTCGLPIGDAIAEALVGS
jgi:glutathione synthase/RimK-type ligase-like ATP-grasp enzyme